VSAIDFPGRAPAIDFHIDPPKRKKAAHACKLKNSHSFFLPPCHPKWLFCDSSSARNGQQKRLVGVAICKSTEQPAAFPTDGHK